MGKKYDAWQKAREASKQTEARLSDVCGGSTQEAFESAVINRQQAAQNEQHTYEEWMEDPAG